MRIVAGALGLLLSFGARVLSDIVSRASTSTPHSSLTSCAWRSTSTGDRRLETRPWPSNPCSVTWVRFA